MDTGNIIPWLAGFTLIVVLAYAIWQRLAVHKAKQNHEPAVPGETTIGGVVRDPGT